MELTEIKITKMRDVDGSDNIRYSALINNKYLAQYQTDGIFKQHLTETQWKNMLLSMTEYDLENETNG